MVTMLLRIGRFLIQTTGKTLGYIQYRSIAFGVPSAGIAITLMLPKRTGRESEDRAKKNKKPVYRRSKKTAYVT